MALKIGKLINNHPFIKMTVFNSQKTKSEEVFAFVDTGFAGFVSITPDVAELIELEPVPALSTRFMLADGSPSEPFPAAIGYACLEGDAPIEGTICISNKPTASIGMEFIIQSGNTMSLSAQVFVMATKADMENDSLFGADVNLNDEPFS